MAGDLQRTQPRDKDAWAQQIMRHKKADYYRRQSREAGQTFYLDELDKDQPLAPSPEDTFQKKQMCQMVLKEAQRLKGTRRKIFQLRAEGLSYKEIALELGISEGAVCKEVSRFRNTLRHKQPSLFEELGKRNKSTGGEIDDE